MISMRLDNLSLDKRMFIISKTYRSISAYFAHWDDSTINEQELDEVYYEFLHRAISTEGRYEFSLVMKEFIARLNNAHSWYTDRKVSNSILPLGFTMRLVDGEWVVHRSQTPDLTLGDVIQSIQNETIETWISRTSRYVCAKNEVARQSEFQMLIPWFLEDNVVEVAVLEPTGGSKSIRIDRAKLSNRPVKTEGHFIGELNTAYIRVPSFNAPHFEERALQFYEQYQTAKTIIVDVRDNNGGSTPMRLMQKLLNVPWCWWTERSRHSEWMYERHSEAGHKQLARDGSYMEFVSDLEQPKLGAYEGNIIILTDRCTHSAAEDFTMVFKTTGRGVVIGEQTAGSTGMPYMYSFENEIQIAIGSIRSYLPGDIPFEGIGIQPDIVVTTTKQDYIERRDPHFDAALDYIRTRTS